MEHAQRDLQALSAALPCPPAANSPTRQCYRISTTSVLRTSNRSGPGSGCDVQLGDQHRYTLVAACSIVPPVNSTVTTREWNQSVVDVGYEGQQFETIDSPTVGYANARDSRDAIDSYRWVWALSLILYGLMVVAGQVAWRLRAARRHADYFRSASRAPS